MKTQVKDNVEFPFADAYDCVLRIQITTEKKNLSVKYVRKQLKLTPAKVGIRIELSLVLNC